MTNKQLAKLRANQLLIDAGLPDYSDLLAALMECQYSIAKTIKRGDHRTVDATLAAHTVALIEKAASK